jgi:hypothetical protein
VLAGGVKRNELLKGARQGVVKLNGHFSAAEGKRGNDECPSRNDEGNTNAQNPKSKTLSHGLFGGRARRRSEYPSGIISVVAERGGMMMENDGKTQYLKVMASLFP